MFVIYKKKNWLIFSWLPASSNNLLCSCLWIPPGNLETQLFVLFILMRSTINNFKKNMFHLWQKSFSGSLRKLFTNQMMILFQWEGERLHYSLLFPWCHHTAQYFMHKNETISCKEQMLWRGKIHGDEQKTGVVSLRSCTYPLLPFPFFFSLFLSLSLPGFTSKTLFWNGQFRLINDLEEKALEETQRHRGMQT